VLPFNPHRALTAAYDDLVAAAVRRYGSGGQGVGLVLYEELVSLRELLAAGADPVIAARVAALREELPRYYRTDPDNVAAHPIRVVGTDPLVIEFDRDAFHRYRYADVADAVLAQTVMLTSRTMDGFEPRRMYLYVIDDDGAIRLWRRPFRYVDLVFGRNRPRIEGVPIAHPMLVPQNLRAMSAGEVVFIGDGEIAAVVANTKSGHFQPPPSTAPLVHRAFTDALGLRARDVDVITVT
jgi:hypothetical protein